MKRWITLVLVLTLVMVNTNQIFGNTDEMFETGDVISTDDVLTTSEIAPIETEETVFEENICKEEEGQNDFNVGFEERSSFSTENLSFDDTLILPENETDGLIIPEQNIEQEDDEFEIIEEEFFVQGASASIVDQGTCGENLNWTLDNEGTLSISGKGYMDDYSSSNHSPWYSKRSNIKNVVIEPGVLSVGQYAFCLCSSIKNVSLPDGLLRIEERGFAFCSGLSTLELPDSVTTIGGSAFVACNALSEIELSDALQTIGQWAFHNCTGLSSITMYTNVSDISYCAFYNCTNLRKIVFPNGIKNVSTDAFTGIPSDATFYGYSGTVAETIAKEKGFRFIPLDTTLKLDKSTAEIATLHSLQLNALITPVDSDQSITWSSSDTSIATVSNNGKVTAKKYGKVMITASLANGLNASCEIQTRFHDVNNVGKAYYVPVYWAVDNGITKSTVAFNPENTVTRGEFVAFIWRMAGSPNVLANTSFRDVNKKTKFYDAIRWAVSERIIQGYSDKTFRPTVDVTRGEAATMLWRWAGRPEPKTKTCPFSDIKASKADSYKAILWGSENGIIKGSKGKFLKANGCTRGNVVTFLYRYNQNSVPQEKVYSISYRLNEGINSPDNPSSYMSSSEAILLSDPMKEGYEFKGWYKDSSFTNRITMIPKGSTGNLVLYAKWEKLSGYQLLKNTIINKGEKESSYYYLELDSDSSAMAYYPNDDGIIFLFVDRNVGELVVKLLLEGATINANPLITCSINLNTNVKAEGYTNIPLRTYNDNSSLNFTFKSYSGFTATQWQEHFNNAIKLAMATWNGKLANTCGMNFQDLGFVNYK